jgi:hypothetical protein
LQFGITFAWLLLWITTVAREVLHGSTRSLAHAYAASAPVIALGFTGSIWELSNAGLAWITLPAAILYALAALALWHFGEVSFSRTHALVRLLFLTLTLVLVLDGDALFIILAAGAAILPYLAKRYSDGAISVGGICCPASPGSGSPPASSPILWTLLARLARRSPTYPPPSTYPLSLSRSPPRTRSCRAPRPESTGPWRTRRFWPGCGVGSRSFRGGDGLVTVAWGLYAAVLLYPGSGSYTPDSSEARWLHCYSSSASSSSWIWRRSMSFGASLSFWASAVTSSP